MAEKYVRMATMKSLTGAPQGAGIQDLIAVVARCVGAWLGGWVGVWVGGAAG